MVEAALHHDETIVGYDGADQDDMIFGAVKNLKDNDRQSLGLTNKNSSSNANESKNNAQILDLLKQIVQE